VIAIDPPLPLPAVLDVMLPPRTVSVSTAMSIVPA
jgi:hypothetical protein